MWTPPHFWALALFREGRICARRRADAAGRRRASETRRQILIYTLLLVPLFSWPALLGFAGPLYVAGVAILGAGFLWHAWAVLRGVEGDAERRACRRMFSFSIAWLFGVFALILIEKMAGLPPFHPIVG